MFVSKKIVAISAFSIAAFVGCERNVDHIVVDDEEEAAVVAESNADVEEILAYRPSDKTEAKLEAPQADVKPSEPAKENVKPIEAPKPVAQAAPKFDAKGVSVDLTEVANFNGASDLAQWQGVKVVRGKGALTQGALETFAKLPQLTEFLWTDASLAPSSEQAFAKLAAAPKLKKARLTGLKLADSDAFPVFALQALAQSPALADLDVSGAPLTADDLAKVELKSGFAKLTKINLYQTKVGDAGVDALAPLVNRLTSLNLDDAGVSPAAADKIAEFSKLTFLHVGRSTLDDASVMKFAKLTNLEKIHITRSAATEEGADKLRKALPNCVVVSQPEN